MTILLYISDIEGTMKKLTLNFLTGIVILLFCCSSLLAAPGQKAVSKPADAALLKGSIRVSGAWALYPMMVRWAEEFHKKYPNVRIDVSAGGAGKGVSDTLAGFVDLGMVSRDLKPEETAKGITFAPVVKDAVFPTMNAKNPLAAKIKTSGINKETFVKLWIDNSPLTWGVAARGTGGSKIQVYTRSDACGAAETWALYLGKKQEDLQGVGVYGDPGLAEAVAKDINGIGFNNLNYAFDAKTGLPVPGIVIIPIDKNNNGKIDTAEDISTKEKAIKAVASGAYPAPPARDLYLVSKGPFKGLAAQFVGWILKEGQKYVDEVGYIRLNDEQLTKTLKKIQE